MAKILVADDNSNVQKTVALALADLGIEVVSVNNGEAAVRKLANFFPDLILADIFMPVRNGYEVCEFVKKDPRFTHVPVVLLVGAFDPFDEREAQRVGADGILKKPFVPPDPLIMMVKTLLDRTLSERLVGVSVSKPAAPAQAKSEAESPAVFHVPVQDASEEHAPQEISPAAGRVDFGEGERPLAFSQLLETPTFQAEASNTGTIEPVNDEQILTSSRDATLGEPIFWRNEIPEAEAEVEPEIEPPVESAAELKTRGWVQDEDSLPPSEEMTAPRPAAESVEIVRDESDSTLPPVADSSPVELDPAAQTPLNVNSGKAPDLAANPLEWMATAPADHSDAPVEAVSGWDEPIAEASGTIDVAEPVVHNEPIIQPLASKNEESAKEITALSAQATEDTARSIPKHDWADMVASLHPNQTEAAAHPTAPATLSANEVSMPNQEPVQSAPANTVEPSSPDAALVEAVVQRVLDKMRPQVVDIITREFLRPVVQALVHREIEKR